jgi:hypothetical protein
MLLQIIAREVWEYEQRVILHAWEFVATPVLLLFLLGISFMKIRKKIKQEPFYGFYMKGLIAKLLSALFFCLIYVYYYNGGDTTAYFESTMAMAKLFYHNPIDYYEVMTSAPSAEIRSYFSGKTGYPYSYLFYDSHTFMVIKFTSIFTIITGKSYLLSSLLLAYFSYAGSWRLFQVFVKYAPEIQNKLAWAILFFPSALFWGSGVSKDTYTYAATAFFVYGVHEFFISKKYSVKIIISILISAWLILSIKPYIFMVLFPGIVLLVFYERLSKLKNPIISFLFFPIALFLISVLSYYVLLSLSGSMSKFSIDRALETAAETNYDLKQDYYGGSSFDIGDFDGTVQGMFKLFFPAVNAGLFRPYIWEGRSVVLLLAGLENFFLLAFTLYILYRTKIIGAFKIISQNSLILFCVIFSILFAFMIGLTTSNFGALVRFKIPLLPFLVSSLFMIDYLWEKQRRKN